MSLRSPAVSFRFTEKDIYNLDRCVAAERARMQQYCIMGDAANRTSTLRALIERECLRLDEELQQQREIMERRAQEAIREGERLLADQALAMMEKQEPRATKESDRQRKSRLQRQRRAKAAKKK